MVAMLRTELLELVGTLIVVCVDMLQFNNNEKFEKSSDKHIVSQ